MLDAYRDRHMRVRLTDAPLDLNNLAPWTRSNNSTRARPRARRIQFELTTGFSPFTASGESFQLECDLDGPGSLAM